MAEQDQDVRVRYTADTSGFVAASQRAEEAVESVGEAAQSSSSQATKAIVTLTDAEKRLAAQIVGAEAAMKAKAAATGLTVTQLRAVEKASTAAAKAATTNARSTDIATTATTALAAKVPTVSKVVEDADAAMRRASYGGKVFRAQLADIATTASMGISPLTILAQQGPDLVHAMEAGGGAAATFKAAFGGLTSVLMAAAPIVAAVTVAAAALGTAYVVLRNNTEDADSAQGLLAARMSGLQHVADSAKSAIADLAATTKRFYESVTETEYQAAEATGVLTAEEVAQAKAIQALRAQIEPQIKAQETLKAALVAQNEVLRQNLASNRLSEEERKKAKAQIDANRRGLTDLNEELDTERAKLQEGIDNIAKTTGARQREREETDKGRASRSADTISRRDNAAAMAEQRWAQEQLNAAFDAEIERLNVRAGFLPTLQSRVEGLSEAEIKYRETIEAIAEAERIGALTTQEAFELRAVAAQDWTAANTAAVEDAAEAEQRLADQRQRQHEQEMARIERERQAKIDNVQAILTFAQQGLEVVSMVIQAVSERGGKAAKRAAKFAKLAAIADIGIKTAQAVMTAFAQFGPPPSPAGIAGAAIATATGIAQAGIVAATELPTYHVGGVKPGETLSRHLPGEGVLNATATRQLGTDGVRDLNMGRMPMAPVLRIGRNEVREMERIRERGGLGVQVGRSMAATRGISGREVLA